MFNYLLIGISDRYVTCGPKANMSTKHISAQYAAGFFDGEGTVCYQCILRRHSRIKPESWTRMPRPTNYYQWIVRFAISNTNREVLISFQAQWGGQVRDSTSQTRLQMNRKPIFQWMVAAKQAESFAKDIAPYVIVKRPQIELFLEFRETMQMPGQRHLPRSVIAKRLQIGRKLARLNRRGVVPVVRRPSPRRYKPTWAKKGNPDISVVPGVINYQGISLPVAGWAKRLCVTKSTIYRRLKRGLPLKQVLAKPPPHTRFLTYEGETLSMSAWAERYGMFLGTLHNRLKAGWTLGKALTQPIRKTRRSPCPNPDQQS